MTPFELPINNDFHVKMNINIHANNFAPVVGCVGLLCKKIFFLPYL